MNPSSQDKQEIKGIRTEKAASPLGLYPHARKAGGFIFLSGIGSRNPEDNSIPGMQLDAKGNCIKRDIEAECRQVFANVRAVLEAAGSNWQNIVDVTTFLTRMEEDFDAYNKVYAEFFREVQPTRTTVEVKRLPSPISIELKVIAVESNLQMR